MRLQIRNVSSLEKIFPEMSCFCAALDSASALKNEVFAYQIAYKTDDVSHCDPIFRLEVESELAEYICFYRSRCVPVLKPAFETEPDSEYLTRQPGLVPDVLEPYDGYVTASHNMSSLWVDVKLDEKVAAGVHSIKVHFREIESGEVWGTSEFQLEIIDAVLPKTDIPYTNWFHCDCISSYHNCEPLSERHWQLIDKYMQVAVEGGMNMILTPLFTPPLDTQVGAERPTVQLVDVAFADGKYTFGFDKLLRWFELCRKNGIEYLELSHLYSQWGAEKTPKIVVLEDGKLIKKFGWHTESMGEEYKEFIRQFIPVLKEFLIANWDKDKVYFHISDEPSEKHIEFYGKISEFIKPLIGEFKQMDAMSDFELYERGFIETPVVATTSINDFLGKDIDNLWVYYCCGQGKFKLSNRFIAMPSWRNRIMGLQLYKFNIKGFLQWGFNFYYNQFSTHLINPYLINDSDGGFPAGDAFGVYPGIDCAIPSIRLKVFMHGLQDMMALKLAESLVGRDKIDEIIKNVADFNSYPCDSAYILNVREKVNKLIKDNIK